MSDGTSGGFFVYRCAIEHEWIDYNGHLRDACYSIILSNAIDALMDHLGIDAAYRETTGNTLYTLEMHLRFLREVKQHESVEVRLRALDADHKRIHLGALLMSGGHAVPAATAEYMLLHVNQGDTVRAATFPPPIEATVQALRARGAALPPFEAGSRRIALRPA